MSADDTGLPELLAGEYAAIYGYGLAGAVLVRESAPVVAIAAARGGLDAHRESRDRLADLITAAGATPAPPEPMYATPFPVTTTAAAVRLLVLLEDRLAAAAATAVGATRTAAARLAAADILAAAALRAVRLRLMAGIPVAKAVPALPGLGPPA